MSKFTEFASIKPIIKQNKWITTNDLIYYLDNECKGKSIIVPCGFISD